jgi:uncharacterized membrane protein YccC
VTTAILLVALFAQAGDKGLQPEWDVRKDLANLAAAVQRLKPVLDQVKAQEWMAKGAPQAYVGQARSAQAEVGYLIQSVQTLQQEPDKLSAALDAIFRMENLEAILGSLIQGIRRYQDPAVGDRLAGVVAQNANYREKLRQYVMDLAKDQEAEFKVMNEETQRCRAALLKQPPAPAKSVKKTEKK